MSGIGAAMAGGNPRLGRQAEAHPNLKNNRSGSLMTQNTTHAVMAQRVEAHDSLDDFPTPPWAARALCTHVLPQFVSDPMNKLTVWEPASNRGYLARPLAEYFREVVCSDIYDYGAGYDVLDFLMPIRPKIFPDMTITNPPFRLGTAFVRRAMEVSRLGCAVLVRGTWMETIDRYELFREHPPTVIAQFAERVPMVKGRYDPKASTATSYAWVVFLHGQTDTRWRHIPPCRKFLERISDFPANPPTSTPIGAMRRLIDD